MVMDMFYSYVETEKKKRVHFHGFMLDVHKSEVFCLLVFASFCTLSCKVDDNFYGQFCLSVPITATRGQIATSLRWHVHSAGVPHIKQGICSVHTKTI